MSHPEASPAATPTHTSSSHHSLPWLGVSLRDASRPAPDPGSVLAAARVLGAMAVPVAALHALGLGHLGPWAVLGAFTAIHGRVGASGPRLRALGAGGLTLVLSVVLGLVVARAPHMLWWSVAVGAGLSACIGLADLRSGWWPSSPLFPLIAFSVAAYSPTSDNRGGGMLAPLIVTIASAGCAVLISMVVRAPSSTAAGPAAPVPTRSGEHWVRATEYGLGAGVSGALAVGIGLTHAYWAMLAAIVPFMVGGHAPRLLRAIHRLVGTLLGLLLGVALLVVLHPSAPASMALVIVLQAGAELVIRRHYGWALVLITPLALIMTQLVAPEPTARLLLDRALLTALGVTVAVALITARHLFPRTTTSSNNQQGGWHVQRDDHAELT